MNLIRRSFFLWLLLLQAAACAAGQEPTLLMSKDDFAARLQTAQREPWAKRDLATLIKSAENFPSSYLQRLASAKPCHLPRAVNGCTGTRVPTPADILSSGLRTRTSAPTPERTTAAILTTTLFTSSETTIWQKTP